METKSTMRPFIVPVRYQEFYKVTASSGGTPDVDLSFVTRERVTKTHPEDESFDVVRSYSLSSGLVKGRGEFTPDLIDLCIVNVRIHIGSLAA